MLAKVSNTYCGYYGLYRDKTGTTEIKTRESAPFEIDDALFNRLNEKGVLVRADNADNPAIPSFARFMNEPVVDPIPEPETDKSTDLGDMSLKELKALAKDCGIPYKVGMSKAELIEALVNVDNSQDEEEPPVLTAALPE